MSALVSCFNVDLGKTIMPPKEDNPLGFFENQRVFELNEQMLEFIGCRWDIPSVDPLDGQIDAVINEFTPHITKLIEQEFSSKIISLKDPRLCFLSPIWEHFLTSKGFAVRRICILRHPQEVSASLQKRNGFSHAHGETLWLDSVLDMFAGVQNDLFLSTYEQLLAEPEQVAQHLGHFLGADAATTNKALQQFKTKFLVPDLRHHSVAPSPSESLSQNESLSQDKSLSPNQSLIKIYQRLCKASAKNLLSGAQVSAMQRWLTGQFDPMTHLRNKVRIHAIAITTLNGERTINSDLQESPPSLNFLLHQSRQLGNELKASSADKQRVVAELVARTRDYSLANGKLKEQLAAQQTEVKRLTKLVSQLDQIELLRKQAEQLQKMYLREQADKEWLMGKYDEEMAATTFLKQANAELDTAHNHLATHAAQLRLGLNRLDWSIRIFLDSLAQSARWRIGNTTVSALNALRGKSLPFEQLGLINQELKRIAELLAQSNQTLSSTLKVSGTNVPLAELKIRHTNAALLALDNLLSSTERLVFAQSKLAQVTVVLVLYNRAELTLKCLRSLLSTTDPLLYKVVIVDNNSSDRTNELLSRLEGVEVIRNTDNVGFLLACNSVVASIDTPYSLFLNNDCEILANSISQAISTIEKAQDIGVVGGKILLLNGELQEAGSIIYADGSCAGYGRGRAPNDFEFDFQRDTDFVSGAFLLTRTDLLQAAKGFDEQYLPAYYEDADYCLSLATQGYRCVYDPQVQVLHYEYGSSEASDYAQQLMRDNQIKFVRKHQDRLTLYCAPQSNEPLVARHAPKTADTLTILYIDDRVPHGYFGSGFPRSNHILNDLAKFGHQVTMLPLNFPNEETSESAYTDIDRRIEIASHVGRSGFAAFWEQRKHLYDVVWVSRPHNLEFIEPLIKAQRHGKTKPRPARLVYDAEAIFADRGRHLAALGLQGEDYKGFKKELAQEVALVKKADVIMTVSERDKRVFVEQLNDAKKIIACTHSLPLRADCPDLSGRKDLLFVGNLDANASPNVDSLLWFYAHVWPELNKLVPGVTLRVIGSNLASALKQINDSNIHFLGRVDNINQYYDQARVFIAPTRFSAGIPIKILEATANGLPCVATTVLAEQLSWQEGQELRVAEVNDAHTFADACAALLQDDDLWAHTLSVAQARYLSEFSAAAAQLQVKECLTTGPHKLVSVHIGKTGGTTLRTILQNIYPGQLHQTYHDSRGDNPQITRCVHGHNVFDHYQSKQWELAGAQWMSIMRDPLQLAISLYYYQIASHNLKPPKLADWLLNSTDPAIPKPLRLKPNVQSKLLRLSSFGKEPLQHYSLLGVTEEFELSLQIAQKLFAWPRECLNYRSVNITPNKPSEISLSKSTIEQFKQLNEEDYGLYEQVKVQLYQHAKRLKIKY